MSSKLKKGLHDIFSTFPVMERYLHAIVLFGVLWQLLSSGVMHVHGDTPLLDVSGISFFHIYGGLILIPWALLFTLKVMTRRQFVDLYPWFYGRFDILKQDLDSLLRLKLPEAKPSGLAACIEGLGLLALLLVLLTGGVWYWFLSSNGPNDLLLSVHKLSVTFIQIYFFGHGTAALLHLIVWWRSQSTR